MTTVDGAGVEIDMGGLEGGSVSKGMGVSPMGDDVSGVSMGD